MALKEAIFKIQCAVSKVEKDGSNPHTKSGYPTLEAVLDVLNPFLSENSIVIEQFTERKDYGWVLITEVSTSDGKESQKIETPLLGIEDAKNQMQALGSSMTYARRYTLMAKFKLTPTDDDGAGAGSKDPKLEFAGKAKAPKASDFLIPDGVFRGKKVSEIPSAKLKEYIEKTSIAVEATGKLPPKWFSELKKVVGA